MSGKIDFTPIAKSTATQGVQIDFKPLSGGTAGQESGPLVEPRSLVRALTPTKESLPELGLATLAGLKFAGSKTVPGALAVGGASMAGEGIRQAFMEEKPMTPKERVIELLKAGGRGVAGEMGGRAVGKAFTMFKGGITPEMQAAAAVAEKEGIQAPVSTLNQNKFIQMGERTLEYSPFGGAITKQKLRALDQFKDFAGRIGDNIGAKTPAEVTGALAKEQTLAFKESYDIAKDKLYDAVMPRVSKLPANATESVNTLKAILERRSGVAKPEGLKAVKEWLKEIEEGGIKTFADLRKFRTNVGQRGKFNDPALSGLSADMSDLYSAISRDLDKTAALAGDDIAKGLKQADDFYAVGKNTLKSKVYKALVAAPQDTIHKIAFVPKSPMQYDMVKEIVGPDMMKDLSGQWFKDITKTKDGILMPKKVLNELEKYSGTIEKLGADFPEIGQKFTELKQVASLLSTGRDVATGSQTTPSALGLGAMYTSLLYSIGKLFTGDLGGAAYGASAAGAQALVSGLGVAGIQSKLGRKALTTGFPTAGKLTGRAAQVGGQIGLQKTTE